MKENPYKTNALAKLAEVCQPGTRLLIVMRVRGARGLSRYLDVYRPYLSESGVIRHQWLSRWVSDGVGVRFSEPRECLMVAGVGVDAGLLVVRALEQALGLPSASLEYEWL